MWLLVGAVVVLAWLFWCFAIHETTAQNSALDGKQDVVSYDFSSMGAIEPLTELDLDSIEPIKIYKFKPKYFLTMGLQNTTINQITNVDKTYLARLIARERILEDHPGTLACLPSAVSMVNELYSYLTTTYFPQRYPTIFTLQPSSSLLLNKLTGSILPLTPPSQPLDALRLLTINMDEDFIMLLPSPDGDGYSLQAYIWCYPAGFKPSDKLGLKLRDIHVPVPGYKEKLEASMDRYFAKLQPGRVVFRTNWSVAMKPDLHEDGRLHVYDGDEISDNDVNPEEGFMRSELQTLFVLPRSGARIMSLHLYMYPLQQIKDDGVGEEMVEAIDGLKNGNAPGMWRYKSAVIWGDKVKAFLRA